MVMKKLLLILPSLLLFSNICKSQTIPYGDFETWNSTSYDEPDSSWLTTNPSTIASDGVITVTKVPGYKGSAVHMQTGTIIPGLHSILAYISNGNGMPYSQKPTGIKGYYRCHILGQDTGILAFEFKKNGTPFKIQSFPFTGNVTTFSPFSFSFSLPSQPDTLLIAAASSNIIKGNGMMSGSWLELDQLSFTGPGVTQSIPGGSFDNWTTKSVDVPKGWHLGQNGSPNTGVSKSTDHSIAHYPGNYSVQLVTQPDSTSAEITTGIFNTNTGKLGGLPFTLIADTITGYYKYMTMGNDSGTMMVYLEKNDSFIGFQTHRFAPVSKWAYFELPISAPIAPDIMNIDISSSYQLFPQSPNTPGSTLLIDNLQLKSQPLKSAVPNLTHFEDYFVAFPDPAKDILNFKFSHPISGPIQIKVFDITGRVLLNNESISNGTTLILPVSQFKPGAYFYEIGHDGMVCRNMFIKN